MMTSYLAHPNVALALLLEHGCEKTHNDYFRSRLVEEGLDPSRFGWASIQLDGGIEATTERVRDWFEGTSLTMPAPQRVEAGLGDLTVALDARGPLGADTARALAEVGGWVVGQGGSVLLASTGALLAQPAFREHAFGSPDDVPVTLAHGQRATRARLARDADARDRLDRGRQRARRGRRPGAAGARRRRQRLRAAAAPRGAAQLGRGDRSPGSPPTSTAPSGAGTTSRRSASAARSSTSCPAATSRGCWRPATSASRSPAAGSAPRCEAARGRSRSRPSPAPRRAVRRHRRRRARQPQPRLRQLLRGRHPGGAGASRLHRGGPPGRAAWPREHRVPVVTAGRPHRAVRRRERRRRLRAALDSSGWTGSSRSTSTTRWPWSQPGVVNADLSRAVAEHGPVLPARPVRRGRSPRSAATSPPTPAACAA